MNERDLGAWILPQPKDSKEYVPIPKIGRTVPFGYKLDEADENWLQPIPLELEALSKAKQYLKQYSSRQVAAWLTKVTGREISHVGLLKRLRHERSHKQKSATYRNVARRLQKALEQAERYEKRLSQEERSGFFDTESYSKLRSFVDDSLSGYRSNDS
jgi:hypothetical protein